MMHVRYGTNVLITSSAAKVLLLQSFQEALKDSGKVFTADLTKECATAQLSDGHFVVPPMSAPNAVDKILELCRANDIGLLVPTRDGELEHYSTARSNFQDSGTFILTPAPESVQTCRNKRTFTEFLVRHGLPSIPIVQDSRIEEHLPLFLRPIVGAAGVGVRKIESHRELATISSLSNYLVHPFIAAPEYTIDLLMDLEGRRAIQAVCRERIKIVAGESKISRVANNPELAHLVLRLGELLGLVGHNTVQAFMDPVRGPLFIEVNPRFGGASNLAIKAGLDSPRRILKMLRGDATAYVQKDIEYGMTMYRYSQDLIVGARNA